MSRLPALYTAVGGSSPPGGHLYSRSSSGQPLGGFCVMIGKAGGMQEVWEASPILLLMPPFRNAFGLTLGVLVSVIINTAYLGVRFYKQPFSALLLRPFTSHENTPQPESAVCWLWDQVLFSWAQSPSQAASDTTRV